MGNKKKNGANVSGDPRKRAVAKAAERVKLEQERFDSLLDEFLSTEVAEKSEVLAETFLSSRHEPFTPDETIAIKRFFLALALGVHAMQLTGAKGTVNFERMAAHAHAHAHARISEHLCKEIQIWMEEKELIKIN